MWILRLAHDGSGLYLLAPVGIWRIKSKCIKTDEENDDKSTHKNPVHDETDETESESDEED